MYKYLIPSLIFLFVFVISCDTTDSSNTNLDLREAITNKTWYELNIEQDLFTGEVLMKYSFAESDVTIDLFPMPCGLGTSFEPIVTFYEEYSIHGDKKISIAGITYEASSVSKDELLLKFENQSGPKTRILISRC
jgi:hypothetical protein